MTSTSSCSKSILEMKLPTKEIREKQNTWLMNIKGSKLDFFLFYNLLLGVKFVFFGSLMFKTASLISKFDFLRMIKTYLEHKLTKIKSKRSWFMVFFCHHCQYVDVWWSSVSERTNSCFTLQFLSLHFSFLLKYIKSTGTDFWIKSKPSQMLGLLH